MPDADLAVVYAALILEDDGIPITGDKIRNLLAAAHVTVEGYWVDLFVEYFKNNDIASLLRGTVVGGAGPAGGGASASADSAAPAAAEPAKEEKKEEEAALDLAGGFDDLFG